MPSLPPLFRYATAGDGRATSGPVCGLPQQRAHPERGGSLPNPW